MSQGHDLDVDISRWLVSEAGLDAIARAVQLLDEHDELAVPGRLPAEIGPDRRPAVLAAAVGRRRAAELGYPSPERLVLTRSALEQASRPAVARTRAERLAGGGGIVDLCCGAGLDALTLSEGAEIERAVDLDPARVVLAQHNLAEAGVGAVEVGDAVEAAVAVRRGRAHADPSRRRDGRRARRLAEYAPDVGALVRALGGSSAAIAVSPAVSWDDPDLPAGAELEFVQVHGDLVEATLWTGDLADADATATLLPGGQRLRRRGEVTALAVGAPGEWLVEVGPAAVRARLHDELGRGIGAWRIDAGRALLSTDEDPGPSPWWRRTRVEAVLPAHPKPVRRWLARADGAPLALQLHGVDADPDRWWRWLGRPERGPAGRRLHLVRTIDGAMCIVTRDV